MGWAPDLRKQARGPDADHQEINAMHNATAALVPDQVRCVVYLRISRDDIKKGRGVTRQLERCRMTMPAGWVIVAVIGARG